MQNFTPGGGASRAGTDVGRTALELTAISSAPRDDPEAGSERLHVGLYSNLSILFKMSDNQLPPPKMQNFTPGGMLVEWAPTFVASLWSSRFQKLGF